MSIRIGILSTANIAKKNVRAMKLAGIEPVAVASRSEEKAKAFAAETEMKDPKIFGSYDELLACAEVDAIYLPLPTSLHMEWLKKAAAAKKHVLIEKPITVTRDQIKEMIEVVEKEGIVFMDGTMWMHNNRTPELRKTLDDPSFGTIKNINSTFSFFGDDDFTKSNIRADPNLDALGSLGDLGWYCIRMSLWIMKWEMPASVHLHQIQRYDSGVIKDCTGTLEWKSGVHATFYCSFQATFHQVVHIHSDKAVVTMDDFVLPDDEKQSLYTTRTNCGLSKLHNTTTTVCTPTVVKNATPQESNMWTNFARLCKEKNGDEMKMYRDWALITQTVVSALDESGKLGKPVAL